jgi:hypothetical protein
MNTASSNDPRIQTVRVTDDEIIAHLADGRVISVPLAWSWRLSEATPKQRANFRLIGSGQGVHWPDVDEDISVEEMLHGVPAHPLRSGPASANGRGGPSNQRLQPPRDKRRAQAGSRGPRT